MAVEVIVNVENRRVALDLESADLKGLKKEFDEWCADDEAMARRRQSYAPVFSMIADTNMQMEIKRKYIFKGGENIFVTWSSLQLETLIQSETPAATSSKNGNEVGLKANELDLGPTRNVDSASPSKEECASGGDISASGSPAAGPDSPSAIDDGLNASSDSLLDESEDDRDYGEVKEYYTDIEWARMPKYLKLKEKGRFEIHEEQNKRRAETGSAQLPYVPDILLSKKPKEPTVPTVSVSSRKRFRTAHSDSDEGNRRSARKRSNEGQGKSRPIENPVQTNSQQSGTSDQGGGFFSHKEILDMKPELPEYDIPKILEEIHAEGSEQLQERIDELNSKGIVFGKERAFIVRLLTRHLYYKIARTPKEVTSDMREGLAKSIVLHYPKYQIKADCKKYFPWDSLYSRGMGRGWIANSARSVQSKHRTRKSKSKKTTPTSTVTNPDDPDKVLENEIIQEINHMMPGKSEKPKIIRGMKQTFEFRQDLRKQQTSIGKMMEMFTHFGNYDGEILQTEFKWIHPSAQDLCMSFQKHLPGMLALPERSSIETPIEDDNLKALLLLAQNLPRDMRVKGDPKIRQPKADLKDIVEVVERGQDIDSFICDKIEASSSCIQPYLILVRSPLNNKITRFFLVLDHKPVQIATGSILKALDLLVKSYFVFNVKYPLGWRSTFHFLATYFGNIFETGLTRPDRITPSEHELIKKISQ